VTRADVPLSEGLGRLGADLLDGDAFTRSELLAARGMSSAAAAAARFPPSRSLLEEVQGRGDVETEETAGGPEDNN
jgi:hypothetical protein